jgi:hypothetical protein
MSLVNVICEIDVYENEIAASIMDFGYYIEDNLNFCKREK